MSEVRIATRRSALALIQAERVSELLQLADPDLTVRFVEVTSTGDLDQQSSIAELTEVGAFVRAAQHTLLRGEADLAVHSLKDLPVWSPDGLELAAIPERSSPYDALVGLSLMDLPTGALVGTGSPRRVQQLLELRPDVATVELRGNVDTRLGKLATGEVDAAVLAEAGLDRLGKSHLITERLQQMVPAPGQGALAVEAKAGSEFATLATTIDDARLRSLVSAERMLLAETGAGCRAALGALATWDEGIIRFETFIADKKGRRRAVVTGDSPESVVAEARKELGL